MNMNRRQRIVLSVATAFVMPMGNATHAAVASGEGQLDEVVITAQRVETDLQRTPIAVTALSRDALEQRNITTVLDLSGSAPSLQIGTRSGYGAAFGGITIRGMGINAIPPASPAVGIYIDEVYYPASYGNLIGIFDVNSIEVLRGPQGTLFGRNTIGGALLYSSNKPALGEFSGFAEATGGNQGRADLQAGVNLPLGDRAALRLSGATTNEAGYVHGASTGVDYGSEHDKEGRLQLRFDVTDEFKLNLKIEDLEQRGNGQASIVTGFNYNTFLGAPFAPNGLAPYLSKGWYDNAGYGSPSSHATRFRLGEVVASFRFSQNWTFKSISAYSVNNSSEVSDEDYTPAPIITVNPGIVRDALFTQEFQLSGTAFDDRLHSTAGVYFYDDHLTNNDAAGSFFGGPPINPYGNYRLNTQSYAVYAQATYSITKQLDVVAGFRYTDEQVKINDSGLFPLTTPFTNTASFTDSAPLFGFNFHVTDDLLLYVKGSKGFRAGGFSPTPVSGNAFEPEIAKTYEAGARWELLDHRLRINPTVYYTLWDNIQFNYLGSCACFPGPLPFVKNAGDAKIKGAELEVQAALTSELSLTASLSLLDGRYTSIAPFLTQLHELTGGSPLEHAPKTSFYVGPVYTLPLASYGKLIGTLSYTWQSRQRSETTDTDNVDISSYGLMNGRLTYQAPGERWSIALWGKNLTNKQYAIGGTNFGAGGAIPTVEVDVGRPREYGATARYNF